VTNFDAAASKFVTPGIKHLIGGSAAMFRFTRGPGGHNLGA
jgi:hypothetical protein